MRRRPKPSINRNNLCSKSKLLGLHRHVKRGHPFPDAKLKYKLWLKLFEQRAKKRMCRVPAREIDTAFIKHIGRESVLKPKGVADRRRVHVFHSAATPHCFACHSEAPSRASQPKAKSLSPCAFRCSSRASASSSVGLWPSATCHITKCCSPKSSNHSARRS